MPHNLIILRVHNTVGLINHQSFLLIITNPWPGLIGPRISSTAGKGQKEAIIDMKVTAMTTAPSRGKSVSWQNKRKNALPPVVNALPNAAPPMAQTEYT